MQVQLLDLSQPGRSVFAYNKKMGARRGLIKNRATEAKHE